MATVREADALGECARGARSGLQDPNAVAPRAFGKVPITVSRGEVAGGEHANRTDLAAYQAGRKRGPIEAKIRTDAGVIVKPEIVGEKEGVYPTHAPIDRGFINRGGAESVRLFVEILSAGGVHF
jgi:hypothetical protein